MHIRLHQSLIASNTELRNDTSHAPARGSIIDSPETAPPEDQQGQQWDRSALIGWWLGGLVIPVGWYALQRGWLDAISHYDVAWSCIISDIFLVVSGGDFSISRWRIGWARIDNATRWLHSTTWLLLGGNRCHCVTWTLFVIWVFVVVARGKQASDAPTVSN